MDITDLKILWKKEKFRPDKKMGQNFLIDKNIRDKILSSLSLGPDEKVVEVGPGFGMMTFAAAGRCRQLFAVEKDNRIFRMMEPRFLSAGNIIPVNEDILEFDIKTVCGDKSKVVLFGNIPYYISAPLIKNIITQRKYIDRVYLVTQEEVASRISACPGSREYGSLSCFVQYYSEVRKLFRIKNSSFFPKPKVESCLFRMDIPPTPRVSVKDEDMLFRIIRKSFSQRRKKIINPLSCDKFLSLDRDNWKNIFESCGVDHSLRAEALSLDDYARISDKTCDVLDS